MASTTNNKAEIGGYESAFLDNLVASYLFERYKALLNPATYHDIYQYDVLVVFKGKKSINKIKYWLEDFQKKVNRAAGNQHLQFTAEIWTTDETPPLPTKEDRGKVATNAKFPSLDMKTSWSPEGDLQFSVFRGKG